jgi:hypothetical protein
MMKKLLFLALCVATLSQQSLSAQPRKALLNRLSALQTNGYMFGHQDDPFYGLTWEWERGRSDTKEASGDYPAVMGFDLGGIEVGDEKNLDSVPFTRIREELIAHYQRGGIVTLSWHPRNPYTGGTAWDNQDTTVVSSILPGGMQHRKFLLWMKRVRNFLNTLRTVGDRPIPIIFRPWHENNGGWFWWGAKQCRPQEYKALWCMLQDYLLSEGFDNLVWSWSPNLGLKPIDFDTYPGNDRVDLVGLDAYQWGTEQDYVRDLNVDLTTLTDFCAQHRKLLALTECGLKNLPDPSWWTRVLKPQIDKYPICYFLVWRNAKHEYFGPAPGEKNALYFNEMIRSSNVMMLKDIAK